MPEQSLPLIAITLGDAAGVGPEVVCGCWQDSRIHAVSRPLVVGHPQVLRAADRLLSAGLEVLEISSPRELAGRKLDCNVIPCLPCGNDALLEVPPGQVDARTGQAAYEAIVAATDLALRDEVDALVTAPISKAALHAAGHDYPGHTELLADRCGVPRFAMMLYLPPGVANASAFGLGVVHVTLHCALADVFARLTTDAIVEKCELAHNAMRMLGAEKPRVGVAALNPHGGESGLFGDEEIRIIAPAVKQAVIQGIDASGPLPTDTLMVAARDGVFDAVVAQYHDQGHIALKLLAMHSAVNITLGLPIVRTSVAHGTAFDRAWQGTAETSGMVAALETASKLATSRAASGAV